MCRACNGDGQRTLKNARIDACLCCAREAEATWQSLGEVTARLVERAGRSRHSDNGASPSRDAARWQC